MNLIEQTKSICKQFEIKPSRSKGQNFLADEAVYDEVVAAAEITDKETVLEVGPGLGFLTAKLAAKAGNVIAVELDDKLAEYLRMAVEAKDIENVEIVKADILNSVDVELLRFFQNRRSSTSTIATSTIGNYKIVANLPYNITSIFLRKFLSDQSLRPEMMVLMLQKEVAERITAKAGEMSLLAVSVQFYAEPEIIAYVPKAAFWPEPKIDSAIVRIKSRLDSSRDKLDEKNFFRLVKFGFSARRKMLKNNLAGGFKISTEEANKRLKLAGFSEKARAQELAVDDWIRLFGCFKDFVL